MSGNTEKLAVTYEEVRELRRALREECRQTELFTERLIPLGLALLRETDLSHLLETILREAQRLASADGATLYMRQEDNLEFFMILNRSLGIETGGPGKKAITFPPLPLTNPEDGKPNLMNAACYSVIQRTTLNLEDIYKDDHFDFSGSRRFDEANRYHTKSILTVPLTGAEGEVVAVLQLINAVDDKGKRIPFSHSIQRMVESLAALAAGALESFAVKERLLRQQQLYLHNLETTQARLREELSEAERYIRAILPPPCDAPLKIDWLLAPCSELGGDSFGYHEIDSDHWALYVLDVCGHGLSAALLSVTAIKVLRSQGLPGVDFRNPGGVLSVLNNAFLMRNHNNFYFTIWYGVYRLSTRELRYSSAGHAPAIVAEPHKKTARKLEAKGLVLGAREGKIYTTQSAILPPRAVLYLISDGTYEVRLPDGTMWPFAKFLELLAHLPPGEKNALESLHATVCQQRAPERLEDDFSAIRILT